jgi:hypothetical protein
MSKHQKNIVTVNGQDASRLQEHVNEVLKMSGSKQRYSGVVSKISGSTTFIKSGDREFLAWSKQELTVGTCVSFRIDQFQAKDIVVETPEPVDVTESAESQPEPPTAMAFAFLKANPA